MNKIIKYTLLSAFFLCSVLACRKDKPIPEFVPDIDVDDDTSCYNFVETGPYLFYIVEENEQYLSPHLNPNNDNEFVYFYRNYSANKRQLIKYNMVTKHKQILVDDVLIISRPKWSKKGWIAFDSYPDYNLWTIKDNGDSLTVFSSNTTHLHPVWDTSGDNLYWLHSTNLTFPHYYLKKGLYDSVVDTVLQDGDANIGIATYSDIKFDNKLLAITYINNKKDVAITDLNAINFTSLVGNETVFGDVKPASVCWSNTEEFVYLSYANFGLYKHNVSTGSYDRLIEYCDSKYYGSLSCSSDGQTLLVLRGDSYKKKDSLGNPVHPIHVKSSIYLIDLNTLVETKINLD